MIKDLTSKSVEPEQKDFKQEELKPIMPLHVPWRVRRAQLEAEDRQKAQVLAKLKKEQEASIADLESELEITEES